MDRTAMAELIAWQAHPRRKPLIMRGARQVGKTWLLQEFGKNHYSRVVYLNLEASAVARAIFEGDPDPARIVDQLALLDHGGAIDPTNTLIVIDEIQEAPRALTALKYFCENAPEYHIACAGSLLGVGMHEGTSFPVGKVDFLDLHPLSFAEFVTALGRGPLAHAIGGRDFALIAPFHHELIDLLRWYYVIGGMPTAVVTWIDTHDAISVRTVQQQLLDAYQRDFSKHAPAAEVPRLNAVFHGIAPQLAKENRKFIYGQIRDGARAKDLELALLWLSDAGLVHQVSRVTTPRVPLAAYADQRAFKLFLLDVGLLGALSELDATSLIEGNALFTEFKGSLTEQHVLQQLMTLSIPTPHYWSNDGGTAEMDFVVQIDGTPVPIEVKAETNLRAKSLKVYRDKFSPAVAVRTSLAPYEQQDGLINLPLYAVHTLPDVVRQAAGLGIS